MLGKRFYGVVIIIALPLLLLGLVISVSAAGRIPAEHGDTGLMSSNVVVSDSPSNDPQTALPTVQPIQRTDTDIQTLKQVLPFTLLQPRNIKGLNLVSAKKMDNSTYGPGAALTYEISTSKFEFRQSKPERPVALKIDPSHVLQEADINGHKGVITDLSGPDAGPVTAILYWSDGSYMFEIWVIGNRDLETILEVARSIGP
jgi:hypothetical protein